MAEDLEKLVKENKVPNIPEVLDAIKKDPSGATLKQVQERHQELLSKTSPPTEKPGQAATPPTKTQPPAPSPQTKPFQRAPSQDTILEGLAKQDKIPSDPTVWDAIKKGAVSLDQVQSRHTDFRAQNPINTAEPMGKVNDPQTVKESAVDKSTILKIGEGALTLGKMSIQTLLPGTVQILDNVFKGTPISPGNVLSVGHDNIAKSIEYRARSTISGMTFGLIPNDMEPMSEEDKLAGYALNVAGGFVTGSLIGKGFAMLKPFARMEQSIQGFTEGAKNLRAVKVAAEGAGLMNEAEAAGKAIKPLLFAKHTLSLAKAGAESGITGLVTGTARSLLNDKSFSEGVSDTLAESLMFTGFGMALYPVAEIAGKLFSSRLRGKTESTLRGLAARPDVQAIADEGVAGGLGKLRGEFVGKAPKTPRDFMISQALDKIAATEPVVGPKAAILASPEILLELSKGNAREVSARLFGAGGPLEALPGMNPLLDRLIKTGKHAEALDASQAAITDVIAKNPEARDFVLAPFANNGKTMNAIYAQRLINTVRNPERFPSLRANILNYLDAPDEANAFLLTGKSKAAPKGFLKKVEAGAFRDQRLKPVEIDQLVGSVFGKALQQISGGEVSNPGVFAKEGFLKTDEVISSAVTFNRELNRSFINAFSQNRYAFDENFVKANPELMEPVQKAVAFKQISTERNATLGKRRDLSLALQDLKEQIAVEQNPARAEQLNAMIQSTKDKQKSLTLTLAVQNKNLRAIQTEMSALSKETLQEVDKFVSDLYIPRRAGEDFSQALEMRKASQPQVEGLRKKLAEQGADRGGILKEIREIQMKYRTKIQSRQQYMEGFGAKDNPYFMRDDSQLADLMNAFSVSGKDFKDGFEKTFGSMWFSENARRKLARELGPNNAFDHILEKTKEMNAAIRKKAQFYNDAIDSLGIFPGSKESEILQKMGEGRMTKLDPEFLALGPEAQQRIERAIPETRNLYNELIDTTNLKMTANNLPIINKRDDYFHHFQEDMQGLPNLIKKFFGGEVEQTSEAFPTKITRFWKGKNQLDPTRTFMSAEKMRKGGEFTDDAIGGMKRYIGPAMERIYYADLIRELDTARHFAPPNMGKFIQSLKDDYLLREVQPLDKMFGKGPMNYLNIARSRLGRGAILYNANVVLQQITSMPMNFAVSPVHGFKALTMMGPNSVEGQAAVALSKNLITRDALTMDIDSEAKLLNKEVFESLGFSKDKAQALNVAKNKGAKFWQSWGNWAMNTFDRVAAKHAYLTAYSKAIADGASKEEAAMIGDRWTEMIQNDPTRISQPKFYQSMVLRTLGQFTSFTTNLGATLMNDLPNIAARDGSTKAVATLVRGFAGVTLANELAAKMGIPAPFDATTFIPFLGSYRFGTASPIKMAWTGIGALTGNDEEKSKAMGDLERSAAGMAMSGGGQIYKVATGAAGKKVYKFAGEKLGFSKKTPNRPTGYGRVKDMVFGRGTNMVNIKERAAAKKNVFNKTRKKLSGKIKRKIFAK